MAQTYFASIQPGLEQALLSEVRRLGGKRPSIIHGGVEFDAARKRLYAAHLELTTPTRIWLRVDEFRARDAPELYNKTKRYGWERLLGPENRVEVQAHSSNSSLYHTGKIRDAVADGLRDHFVEELDGLSAPTIGDEIEDNDKTPQVLMARLEDDRCQLNLDASGERLHLRGWRTEAGQAPLRETIASSILELIEWKPDQGLIDPMCGSGTIPIVAAHRGANRPPGLNREFSFQNWQNFQPQRYDEIRDALRAQIKDELPSPIVGRDREESLVELSKRNADRAGADSLVDFSTAELGDSEVPEKIKWIVTNPPYGSRLEQDDIIKTLIDLWRSSADDCQLAFLWPKNRRPDVTDEAPDSLRRVVDFKNGGIPVDLWSSA